MLTHHPPATSALPVTFPNASIDEAIQSAHLAADGKDVGLFGSDIPRQALDAGLLDEMIILIIPVLLGGGRRLHEHEGPPIKLARMDGPSHAAVTMVLRLDRKQS